MNLVNLTAIMNIGLLIILKIKNVLMERKSSTFRSIFNINITIEKRVSNVSTPLTLSIQL